MSYFLFVAEPAVCFYNDLDEDDRRQVLRRLRRIADFPGQSADFREPDDSGRDIRGVIEGIYAILYYVDDAVKEVKVIEIRFADI